MKTPPPSTSGISPSLETVVENPSNFRLVQISNNLKEIDKEVKKLQKSQITDCNGLLFKAKEIYSPASKVILLPVISHEKNLTYMLTSKACDLNVT